MSITLSDIAQDFYSCELCGSYTPADFCPDCGDRTCEYCLAEYGCDFPGHP